MAFQLVGNAHRIPDLTNNAIIAGSDSGENTCIGRGGRGCCCCCSFRQERNLATPKDFWPYLSGAVWMEDFEEIAQANNWSQQARLDIIPLYLKDPSTKQWFRENRHAWRDFQAFKRTFLHLFK
ncbi:hypothetical protein DFQ26_006051 [Actinomortierella ambigua]|nr:hypothetical protein DFQ26_006051 [Actinomortierella ambigua]